MLIFAKGYSSYSSRAISTKLYGTYGGIEAITSMEGSQIFKFYRTFVENNISYLSYMYIEINLGFMSQNVKQNIKGL